MSRVAGVFGIILLVSLAEKVFALENLRGSARLSGVLQEANQNETESFDQQYLVNYRRALLPYLQARFSLNYHDLQTRQQLASDVWHGELQPAGDLSWANPFFTLGANYRYRQVRDWVQTNNALMRGAGLVFKTRFVNLPQSTVQYDWNRNSTNAGFLPLSTQEKRFQYRANYAYKTASVYYNYTHREFENLSTVGGYKQQQHVFRLDYSEALLKNRMRFSGGYLFTYSKRQETGSGGQFLTQIPASVGLYANDETPNSGLLDSAATLIDNNLITATDPPIDIGSTSIHQNIGLGFTIPRQINLIFIYTDTLSDNALTWTVYTSDDNLEWSPLLQTAVSLFNVSSSPTGRYEISFSPTTARYFKVVNSGFNIAPQVHVTEIQAFQSLTQETAPNQSENHRVNASGSYQMHRTLRIGLDAALGTVIEDETSQQRHEADMTGSLSYRPINQFSAAARYQHSLVDYRSDMIPFQETDTYSLVFSSNPLENLEMSLSGSHVTTQEDEQDLQSANSGLLRISALFIPGLSAISEVGFTRDERPQSDITTDSWTYRVSTDVRPYSNFNLVINYSTQFYSSNLASVADRRQQLDLRYDYRLTRGISLRGGNSWSREDEYQSRDQDYALSWSLSERLSASANARFQDNTSGYETDTFGLQTSYVISDRSSAFASYSLNEISQPQAEETFSYQIGFNTGF